MKRRDFLSNSTVVTGGLITTAALSGTAVLPGLLGSTAQALSTGARAPEIGRPSTEGRRIRMSGLRGKVVIVDFFASWCEPCREELPALNRIYSRHREAGLVIVGVSVDREERNMTRFLRRVSVDFPVVHDAGQQIAGRYEPPTMPTSYIIDRRGVVRHIHEGFRSGDDRRIDRHVRGLL